MEDSKVLINDTAPPEEEAVQLPPGLKEAAVAHRAGQLEEACRLYTIYLAKEPTQPHGRYLFGTCLLMMDWYGQACAQLKQAVNWSNRTHLPALSNLAATYRKLGNTETAEEIMRECMAKCEEVGDWATFSDCATNMGAICHGTGRNIEAISWLDRAVEAKPDHNIAHWNKGLAHLSLGQWAEGWEGYDWGYKAGERRTTAHVGRYMEWLNQSIDGKTLLVWGEQGLGDEVLFASSLRPLLHLNPRRVIFDCHYRLTPVFQRSFPEIEVVGRRKDPYARWALCERVDYHIPIGSLPRKVFTLDDFPIRPYLRVDPARAQWWRNQQPSKVRIGISWRGGRGELGEMWRSLPLERFAPIIQSTKGQDVEWVSCQYGRHWGEVLRFNRKYGCNVWHSDYANENLDEQFALIKSCDLLITVITTAVHAAGAVGTDAWCLTPLGAPWKFVHGEQCQWHSPVKQYWQSAPYEWDDVLDRIKENLGIWLKKKEFEK